MFEDKVFVKYIEFEERDLNETVSRVLYQMVRDYFNGLKEGIFDLVEPASPACIERAYGLLPQNYSTFMELIKVSIQKAAARLGGKIINYVYIHSDLNYNSI
jgi:hypothetical protein